MTELLEKAFTEASKLSADEQDLLAMRLLAELTAESDFDRVIQQTASKLSQLAEQSLEEKHTGLTEDLDSNRL